MNFKNLKNRILAFTEKIQEQLYKLANELVKIAMSNRAIDISFENQTMNKNIIEFSKISLEATR